MRVGCIPGHMGLSIPTVGDTKNLSTLVYFPETTLSQHLLILLSIFDVWGHMRTLCAPTGHPERYESIPG